MPYQYAHGDGGGRWILALIFLILIIGAVIWVVSALLREREYRYRVHGDKTSQVGPSVGPSSDAVRILDERFARGEIDAEEYQQRRDLLRSHT